MYPTFVFDNKPRPTVPQSWDLLEDPFYFRKNEYLPNIASGNTPHCLFSHGGILIDCNEYHTKLVSDITDDDENLFYLIEPWPEYNSSSTQVFGPGYSQPISWGLIIRHIPDNVVKLAQDKRLTIILHIPEYTSRIEEVYARIEQNREGKHIPASQFKFVSGMQTDKFYFWPSFEYSQYVCYQGANTIKEVNIKQRARKFTCLNRIDKGHRRYVAYQIWKAGLVNDGYFSYSFLKYDPNGASFNGPEAKVAYWSKDWSISDAEWKSFHDGKPYKADNLDQIFDHNHHWIVPKHHYQEAYWNIVTETGIDEVPFLTEKTFKPIANLQPFVIIGSYASLRQLQELGYKTFCDYIDESYDNILHGPDRTVAATAVALDLAQMSHAKHMKLMQNLTPILEFNQRHFFRCKHRLGNFVKYLHREDKMYNWLRDCNYD